METGWIQRIARNCEILTFFYPEYFYSYNLTLKLTQHALQSKNDDERPHPAFPRYPGPNAQIKHKSLPHAQSVLLPSRYPITDCRARQKGEFDPGGRTFRRWCEEGQRVGPWKSGPFGQGEQDSIRPQKEARHGQGKD